jgi:hypothetical protein
MSMKKFLVFRRCATIVCFTFSASLVVGQSADAGKRFNSYLNNVIGPFAIAETAVGAGFRTATNDPKEWGGTWESFGRRFASGLGKNAIEQTTTFTLDEAFQLRCHEGST